MLNENDLTSNNAGAFVPNSTLAAVGLPQSGNSLLNAGASDGTPASSDSTNTVNPYLDISSGTDDTSLFTGSGYQVPHLSNGVLSSSQHECSTCYAIFDTIEEYYAHDENNLCTGPVDSSV